MFHILNITLVRPGSTVVALTMIYVPFDMLVGALIAQHSSTIYYTSEKILKLMWRVQLLLPACLIATPCVPQCAWVNIVQHHHTELHHRSRVKLHYHRVCHNLIHPFVRYVTSSRASHGTDYLVPAPELIPLQVLGLNILPLIPIHFRSLLQLLLCQFRRPVQSRLGHIFVRPLDAGL